MFGVVVEWKPSPSFARELVLDPEIRVHGECLVLSCPQVLGSVVMMEDIEIGRRLSATNTGREDQ